MGFVVCNSLLWGLLSFSYSPLASFVALSLLPEFALCGAASSHPCRPDDDVLHLTTVSVLLAENLNNGNSLQIVVNIEEQVFTIILLLYTPVWLSLYNIYIYILC